MAFVGGDEVSLFARLVQVGRTSVRVSVEARRRRRDRRDVFKVTQVVVCIAVDGARRRRPLPSKA